MATISTPRASLSVRSPSSTRSSLDTSATPSIRTPTTSGPSSIRTVAPRRNRAALRDYYGLKGATAASDSKLGEDSDLRILPIESIDGDETLTELDKEGFDAQAYVDNILSTAGLEGVLKVEADLVSQIRNLDSDRKSLVYDNYSKLIAATDTIRKMRTNMDPLAPTTHTLSPAISHIAETAASLSASMQEHPGKSKPDVRVGTQTDTIKVEQRKTVKWVLATPQRLRKLVDDGYGEEAQKEWIEIRRILDKWKGVEGASELREECEGILKGDGET
ncbi:hypothetical protein GQ43DRAFT_365338 [Delitschia confertaspora ATCC 74209]|uniref:Vacuolar protein sorting-associated protein 51 homolog n=1 Tax=Delitschia confertaspora ATCC 74209 TaxID=1513339 RepID=A0A9P4JX36_9PLEO|nr:hypothetical protein GQ43DRAFT_365338 [Delitschia confertaspora ATCC 74209]